MDADMREEQGLSDREAKRLLMQMGPNTLKTKQKLSPLRIFAGQFRDVMVLILLAATAISALLGEAGEALAIVAIVLVNALLGFFQEWRTERTLEALADMAAPGAHVLRDGARRWIPAVEVVVGDVMLLEAGDRIAADALVLEQAMLSCDESLLTGESQAIEKRAARKDDRRAVRESMVFMGTNVVQGRAMVCVTDTGMKTEMGAIAGLLESIEEEPTPLQLRLDQVGRTIGALCLIVCAVVAVTGVLRGEKPFDMLIIGISLAVAAVPEGLPAIVTISLALAVRRILKRNALIKKLHAVETLGCATVICSDKTGTLTENRMTARQLFTLSGAWTLEEIKGQYPPEICAAARLGTLQRLVETAAFCNDAHLIARRRGLKGTKTDWVAEGEPTEAGLLLCAARLGVNPSGFIRESEQPFDAIRKRMSVTGLCADGRRRVFVKGAPELLLELCSSYLTDGGTYTMTSEGRRRILRQSENMAADALRVLGFAFREDNDARGNPERGLTFVGLAGLYDPPRVEAVRAVADCRMAHIKPVMITGDHAVTARAIATQLDILRGDDLVVTGEEMDRMTEERLRERCPHTSVFARVTPAHKLRIVRAFKSRGEVVAMTGDGVNDAPALKEASIGVAMGESGTDVTREAAEVILLDDNFATLVAAIEEGRTIYRNIRRFLRYLLSCNCGEVITMFFGMLMGMPVILTPIQLLLVNLVTDGLPAIALGLEPTEEGTMRERPRAASESIFANGLLGRILFRGALIGLTTLGIFTLFADRSASLETARTGALATLIMTQLFHVFECRSEHRGILEMNPCSNPLLLLAVLLSLSATVAAIYVPAVAHVFETTILTRSQLLTVLLCSGAVPLCSSLALMFSRHVWRGVPDASSDSHTLRSSQ